MSKRRLKGAPAPDLESTSTPMRPVPALVITGALIALVVAAGVGLSAAARPAASGWLAKCEPGRQLAPRVYTAPPPMCIDSKKGYTANINTTKGRFSVVFLAGAAPQTVNNFIVLAQSGYYTGLTFWRIEDWVVQTGDPQGDGRGGPGYTLPEEPPAANDKWVPGSLGMARVPGGPISGGQFFITKNAWPGGDPTTAYNRFATITLGFDMVGQLTRDDRVLGIEIRQITSGPSPSPSV